MNWFRVISKGFPCFDGVANRWKSWQMYKQFNECRMVEVIDFFLHNISFDNEFHSACNLIWRNGYFDPFSAVFIILPQGILKNGNCQSIGLKCNSVKDRWDIPIMAIWLIANPCKIDALWIILPIMKIDEHSLYNLKNLWIYSDYNEKSHFMQNHPYIIYNNYTR